MILASISRSGRVTTNSESPPRGMFSLELFLPFVELVDDCIEMLGVLECTVPKVYAL